MIVDSLEADAGDAKDFKICSLTQTTFEGKAAVSVVGTFTTERVTCKFEGPVNAETGEIMRLCKGKL